MQCILCFTNFDHTENHVFVPCNHDVCKECAEEWLSSPDEQQKCPLCLQEITETQQK